VGIPPWVIMGKLAIVKTGYTLKYNQKVCVKEIKLNTGPQNPKRGQDGIETISLKK
jgi:hypothetical protein